MRGSSSFDRVELLREGFSAFTAEVSRCSRELLNEGELSKEELSKESSRRRALEGELSKESSRRSFNF
jgi:hypothetical protein